MDSKDIVTTFWRLFDERRFEETRALLNDGFVADWPQTRERIFGPENYIRLNRAYPGVWRCHLKDLVADGDRVATEVEITDGRLVVYATAFFTLKDGKIAQAREFFADPVDPPFDRSRWTERY